MTVQKEEFINKIVNFVEKGEDNFVSDEDAVLNGFMQE